MKRILFSFIFLLLCCHVFATGGDSSVYKKYYGFKIQYVYSNDFDHAISIDSALSGFQRYDPATLNFGNVEIGNLGYPGYSQIFAPVNFTDFDLGFRQFDSYLFSTDKVRYYYAKHPMTQVQYTIGAKNEKMFTFSHTQNILRNWNVGLDAMLIGSQGFYFHQKTNYTDLDAYTWYRSKKQHYNLFATFVFNDMDVRENGGVQNDNVFTNPNIFIKSLAPVNLDTAENFMRTYSFAIQQSWDFGSYTDIKINDSTTYKKLVPVLRIQDDISYTSTLYRFNDDSSDNSFYGIPANNELLTSDSLRFKHFSNVIGFSILDKQNKFLPALFTNNRLTASFNTDWYNIKQETLDTSFVTLGLKASYYTNVIHPNSLFYDLAGDDDIINFKKSTYKLSATVGFAFNDSITTVSATGSNYSTPPTFVATRFSSNFNNWSNNFNLENIQALSVSFNSPRWKTNINVSFYNITNYIYWGLDAQPYQLSKPVNAVVVYIQKDFKFFRNFHFNNELLYQQVLSQTGYINLPSFVSRHSLYYGNDLFKHALHTEIGMDVNYNTAFYVPAYMPESGQFYLQFNSQYPTYPVTDFFVSIRIKTLRAFFKVANADQNLFEPGYFNAQHYAMPDLHFVAGVNWTFRN